ncbi:hypothetical protein EVA_21586 [gut metagenome]|uniref:Uncharacterized protein n=1 Tax=gut metagenome TaxID=749906 RepID=J9F5Y8_9ZZZZ
MSCRQRERSNRSNRGQSPTLFRPAKSVGRQKNNQKPPATRKGRRAV